jgi:hypothetical protein
MCGFIDLKQLMIDDLKQLLTAATVHHAGTWCTTKSRTEIAVQLAGSRAPLMSHIVERTM